MELALGALLFLAIAFFVALDRPEASAEVYAARLERCMSCPERRGAVCGVCGCAVRLKCKIADESCPLPRPRWTIARKVDRAV